MAGPAGPPTTALGQVDLEKICLTKIVKNNLK